MESKTIRNKFLEFFKSKNHKIVPSAPIVIKNDPTLMFTNAGMNQFKDYFLGHQQPESTRIADTQKCLRVSGKHNDLEEVGIDTYHHTMFEMLGNWSFGDYFKKEAIEWGWELLTKVYGLPEDRLYASVFEGDKSDSLEADSESFEIWKTIIPEDRILYGSKKDNFWEMGDTGPCGPSSEIHIDLRGETERKKVPGKDLVNQDHPLVIELWNLVFIEFQRLSSGDLEPLPAKHVDTGMGFERLAMAIQGKESNYDTDVFTPFIEFLEENSGRKYGENEMTDITMRVLSDHVRAIGFTIADGQLPSNTGAGYVIRRILRRAVRYGFTYLDFNEPVLHKMIPILSDQFSDVFPELKEQVDFVKHAVEEEEISFLRTLETGLKRLDKVRSELGKKKIIPGQVAFELYDTFGFPFDLTSLIARENGLSADEEGFRKEMDKQKTRSKTDAVKETGDWTTLNGDEPSVFVGYDSLDSASRITKYRKVTARGKDQYQLVFDKTPFYAESGGQVGDQGYIQSGDEKISIIDTQKENELIVHYAEKLPSDPGQPIQCRVNGRKRALTMNNHSATHLLHAALREVLGEHVEQRGSLVNDKLLRFDFSHFAKMTDEEIQAVEKQVNEKIRENIHQEELNEIPLEEAKTMGAMALFGEKYGETVRVIVFDKDYSVELCGGTHVPATGSIGLFKITSESSISAGVRRIEAITAVEAEKYVEKNLDTIREIRSLLKDPKDLRATIESLVNERQKLSKQLETVYRAQGQELKRMLMAEANQNGDINVIIMKIEFPDSDELKNVIFQLKREFPRLYMVLAANVGGKPQISVMISEALVEEMGINAGNIVKDLAKDIKGGGGGQPFYAVAGGSDLNGLDAVVKKAPTYLNKKS